MSRKLTGFFQRKASETTFLNDEDGDFQIHSKGEKTNRHDDKYADDTVILFADKDYDKVKRALVAIWIDYLNGWVLMVETIIEFKTR